MMGRTSGEYVHDQSRVRRKRSRTREEDDERQHQPRIILISILIIAASSSSCSSSLVFLFLLILCCQRFSFLPVSQQSAFSSCQPFFVFCVTVRHRCLCVCETVASSCLLSPRSLPLTTSVYGRGLRPVIACQEPIRALSDKQVTHSR